MISKLNICQNKVNDHESPEIQSNIVRNRLDFTAWSAHVTTDDCQRLDQPSDQSEC